VNFKFKKKNNEKEKYENDIKFING